MLRPYVDFLGHLIAGTSFPIRFTIDKDDVIENIGDWTDWRLTGKTALAQTDSQALFQKTLGSGLTILSAPGGVIEGLLLPADTIAIVKTTRVYVELQSDEAAAVWTPATGYLMVYPSVTLTA